MIVTCPACSSRYRIREDKIQGRGARITCPSCGHKFVVEREQPQENSGVRRVPAGFARDEDDEADVPTTVMPHGSQIALTIKKAQEAARAAEAAGAGGGRASMSPSDDAPRLRGGTPVASGAGKGGSRVVMVALVLVGVAIVALALAGMYAGS